ncbi:ribosome biogenesis protein NOP53-like [Ptychodera flava]|uniref:ribosome biogenesis protein NOP53-like n=1 Tax=Ptychodera flava TaxID=63121 RepID=UPI00396AA829
MADTTKSKRRTHGSRNKKKGWKKSDVKDVEEHLEDQRLQLRTGGLVAEKTDEQLFFVEKTSKDQKEDELERSKKKESKPLHCYRHLQPNPKIKPAPKPTAKKQKKSKRVLEIEEKEKQGIYTKSKKRKLDDANAYRKKKQEKLKSLQLEETNLYDLWGDNDILAAKEVNEKTKAEANEHFLKVTKKVRKKAHNSYTKKPSARPAVEVIAPGGSYNPSYDDHQSLLQEAHKQEMRRLNTERDLNRQTSTRYVSRAAVEDSYLEEMSAGLFDDDETDDEDDDDHESSDSDNQAGDEARPPNPPVRADERKTQKQRRKEKARKEEEKQRVIKKEENRKLNDVYRLRSLKAEINEKEKEIEERKQKRWEKRNDPTRIKKIGRQKYQDPFLEIKLSEELVPNLRLLKPEGNLIDDRFKSLQRRNIIVASVPMKTKRKYKIKMVEKRSHREFK